MAGILPFPRVVQNFDCKKMKMKKKIDGNENTLYGVQSKDRISIDDFLAVFFIFPCIAEHHTNGSVVVQYVP